MYPFQIIVIGASDGLADLTVALAEQGAAVERRFDDLHALRTQWVPTSDDPHVFALRLRGDEDIEILHEINETFPGFPLLGLVEGNCDAATLFRINRAGAAQLVPFPAQGDELHAALDTLLRQFGRSRRVGMLIAVSAVPDGRDAAAFAVNVAHEIAHRGVECILAEPGARFGRLMTYLEPSANPAVLSPISAGGPLTLTGVQQALIPVAERLRVLPGPPQAISTKPPDVGRLVQLVDLLRQVAGAVVLDAPLTFDEAYFETLTRSEHVLLVTEQTVPALHVVRAVREALTGRRPAGVQHLVLNHYDPRQKGFDAGHVGKLLNAEAVLTVADDPAAWMTAVNNARPLRSHSPRSPALADINRIVETLLEKAPTQGPSRSGV